MSSSYRRHTSISWSSSIRGVAKGEVTIAVERCDGVLITIQHDFKVRVIASTVRTENNSLAVLDSFAMEACDIRSNPVSAVGVFHGKRRKAQSAQHALSAQYVPRSIRNSDDSGRRVTTGTEQPQAQARGWQVQGVAEGAGRTQAIIDGSGSKANSVTNGNGHHMTGSTGRAEKCIGMDMDGKDVCMGGV